MKTKLPAGTLQRLWEDSENWRAGFVYFCREDPRLFVPKRHRWAGWTLNFANLSSLVALGILLSGTPILLAVFSNLGLVGSEIWYLFLAVYVVAVCIASWFLSSTKRFEREH